MGSWVVVPFLAGIDSLQTRIIFHLILFSWLPFRMLLYLHHTAIFIFSGLNAPTYCQFSLQLCSGCHCNSKSVLSVHSANPEEMLKCPRRLFFSLAKRCICVFYFYFFFTYFEMLEERV